MRVRMRVAQPACGAPTQRALVLALPAVAGETVARLRRLSTSMSAFCGRERCILAYYIIYHIYIVRHVYVCVGLFKYIAYHIVYCTAYSTCALEFFKCCSIQCATATATRHAM